MLGKKLLFVLTIITTLGAFAQNKSVKSGEKFVYAASYNMSGLMTQLAHVNL